MLLSPLEPEKSHSASHVINRLRQSLGTWRHAFPPGRLAAADYFIVFALGLGCNLLWFDFAKPPITGNASFFLYPWEQISSSLYLYSLTSWPGSSIPLVFNLQANVTYGAFMELTKQNYSASLYLSQALFCSGAAMATLYLGAEFLEQLRAPKRFAYWGVFFVLFNFGVVEGESFNFPLFLIVIGIALLYLSVYRQLRYTLLFGAFSFFLLTGFPTGALLTVEQISLVAVAFLVERATKSLSLRSLQPLTSGAFRIALCGILSAVANGYLIYPYARLNSVYYGALTSASPNYPYSLTVDQIQTLPNAIRLIDNWALSSGYAAAWMGPYLASPVTMVTLFTIPLLAFSAILYYSRVETRNGQRVLLVSFLLLLMTLFISKSNNPPAGWIFVWIVQEVPFARPFYDGGYSGMPFLILAYAVLSAYGLSQIMATLQGRGGPPTWWSHLTRHGPTRTGRIVHRSRLGRAQAAATVIVVTGLGVAALISVYPMLSPLLTQGNPEVPLGSSLPPYYLSSSAYLSAQGAEYPVMVFPPVAGFSSYVVNNTTWYNGIDIYSGILQNPTISEPLEYTGFVSGTDAYAASAIGFIYSLGNAVPTLPVGASSNFTETPSSTWSCLLGPSAITGGQSLPCSTAYSQNLTSDPGIAWSANAPGDSVMSNGSLTFFVNSSAYIPTGHWFPGQFSRPQNLSADNFLILTYRISNLSSKDLWIGIFNNNGYGRSWYNVSDSPTLVNGSYSTVAVELNDPTWTAGLYGLDNVSAIVVNYLPPAPAAGSGSISLEGALLANSTASPFVAWSANAPGDSVMSNGSLTFFVNSSAYIPTGHWFPGQFSRPQNLSADNFLILTYRISNLSSKDLWIGIFNNNGYGRSWYNVSDSPTLVNGSYSTVAVELNDPTWTAGLYGLDNVSAIVLNYQPTNQIPSHLEGKLSIRSIGVEPGTPSGQSIGADLAILGIKYAYVDTSIQGTVYPGERGDYYNSVFSDSSAFTLSFRQGSVSIYRDRLYSGLVTASSSTHVWSESTRNLITQLLIGQLPINTTYVQDVPPSESVPSVTFSSLTYQTNSLLDYTVQFNSSTGFVLQLHTGFDPGWTATVVGGGSLEHIRVDGVINGWIVPSGTGTIEIAYQGQRAYAVVEPILIAVAPSLSLGYLAAWWIDRRRRLLRRSSNDGSVNLLSKARHAFSCPGKWLRWRSVGLTRTESGLDSSPENSSLQ